MVNVRVVHHQKKKKKKKSMPQALILKFQGLAPR